MKKPSFAVWASLISAVLLIVASVFLQKRPSESAPTEGTGLVELREKRKAEVIDLEKAPEPEPTQEPAFISGTSADIILESGDVILTLPSAEEAELLLKTYVERTAEAIPDGERLLTAYLDKILYIVPAGGTNEQISYTDALTKLMEEPELIPVHVETERREVSSSEIEVKTEKNKVLGKGSRMYTQIGSAGRKAVTVRTVYVAGEPVSENRSEPVTEFPAFSTIIQEGKYVSKRPDGEPDRHQGEQGKDADGFSIHLPMQVSIYSYFGTREGIMHNGIDQKAREGQNIAAPAEGVVAFIGHRGEYGNVIDIDHGNGFVSRLTHCNNISVELNQRVFQGETVATLAAAENGSKVTHSHYELLIDGIPYNPLYYYKK